MTKADETLLRAVVHSGPDALVLVDDRGDVLLVNDEAEALFGRAAREMVGAPLATFVPAWRDDAHVEPVPGRAWTLGGTDAKVAAVRADATIVPVEAFVKRLPTASADARFVLSLRDASVRTREAEALRRSEDSLARAQRAAHVGSWDWDLRDNAIFRSEELFRIFGAAPDPARYAKAWSLFDHVHADDRERVRREIDAAVGEARSYAIEHRIVRDDGIVREVLHRGDAVLDERGKAVRMVGTVVDQTERKHAEHERERASAQLLAVLGQAPVGILMLVDGGRRAVPNARARDLLGGVDAEQGIASYAGHVRRPNGEIVAADDLPGARALRGERVDAVELAIGRPDGSLVPVLVSAAPIVDAGGAVDAAVVTFEDITALKQLEKLRVEWSSIVAHDLRQPLNGMLVTAQLLARGKCDVAEVREAAADIADGVHRLDRMVRDLLDLSRLEARRLVLVRKPTDVLALVRRAAVKLAQAHDRAFDVRASIPTAMADVDGDRVTQVMENLLSNAVKYGRAGAAVVVDVAAADDTVSVAVTNEGEGIPPAELPRLFERFHRTAGARKSGVQGIGLGLHIVRELVEAHGGRVSAESVPGATTTFRFALPVRAP